ncbi:MAG TPA: hypothetical protein VHF45_08975 [Thermoleophilaceae bacterium]|nr:hypothetical protein [Thermoleophilaceae bacterium]
MSEIVREQDQGEIIPWAREQGPPGDIPALVERDGARELIQAELDRVNAGSANVEQIKKFILSITTYRGRRESSRPRSSSSATS